MRNWISSFIQNEILVCNSINLELQTKACCEFILYCYQLKELGLLDQSLIDILLTIKNHHQTLYYRPLLELCLENRNQIDIDSIDCIENNYIRCISINYGDFNYWNKLTNTFIFKYANNGLNEADIYGFTHIIFYSTNFGNNFFINQLDSKIIKIIRDITLLCIELCHNNKNWDLSRELYIVLLIIDESYLSKVLSWITIENSFIKSQCGWILSDGENLSYYEYNYNRLSFKKKYSLYHTTLISDLLEKIIGEKLKADSLNGTV